MIGEIVMLLIAGTLAMMWLLITVAEVDKYKNVAEYEPDSHYKWWLAFCIIWTPIAIWAGPIVFQALIMVPMTAHYLLIFYLDIVRP